MAKGMKATSIHKDDLGAVSITTAESRSPFAANELDPERVARRILNSLAAEAGASLEAPAPGATEYKSLGVEKLPFTGTQTVKFRQHVHKIPVYGSLIAVELDASNNFMAVNSSVGEPSGVDPVATLSPAEALARVRQAAGYGDRPLEAPVRLYFYFDQAKKQWRLVYIVEDVLRYSPRREQRPLTALPEYSDFVLDAHTGDVVDELPRTHTMAENTAQENAADSLARPRDVRLVRDDVSGAARLHDPDRNVHTHDFEFRDTFLASASLPGRYVQNPPNPWDPAAISAHANAAAVADFLREVLLRDGLDGVGGKIVSSVNCVRFGQSSGREWRNAAWIPGQMIYGQRQVNGQFRSYAAALDVVAHELLHGLTSSTARLEYRFQSGALNESYSDIFGIIVSNLNIASIDDWNWEMGEDLTETGLPIRDLRDPARFNQPAHMDNFRNVSIDDDYGGVHSNSGIHNKAAFNILTAKSDAGHLFTPVDVARLFYVTLLNHLTRNSEFIDSRRGAILAAKTLFQLDPRRDHKVAAIQTAFDEVGIVESTVGV